MTVSSVAKGAAADFGIFLPLIILFHPFMLLIQHSLPGLGSLGRRSLAYVSFCGWYMFKRPALSCLEVDWRFTFGFTCTHQLDHDRWSW